jgi:hypothetical protein
MGVDVSRNTQLKTIRGLDGCPQLKSVNVRGSSVYDTYLLDRSVKVIQ